MFRGINRQAIFEDDEDAERFLEILAECKAMDAWQLFGYCLMGNHVHILIGCDNRPLGGILKRIGVRYVPWFNKKYGRIGHLFQDRYRSEPIADNRQLLAALRYIHQNPLKARLCQQAGDYRLSSYGCYVGRPGITDVEFVLKMLSEDKDRQRQEFEAHMLVDEDAEFIDDVPVRMTDRECKEVISDIAGTTSAAQFQALSPTMRDKALRQMRGRGLSIRQIVRLTGVPFGIVRGK
jgi:REP element-mobilizing transposase RayT